MMDMSGPAGMFMDGASGMGLMDPGFGGGMMDGFGGMMPGPLPGSPGSIISNGNLLTQDPQG